MAHEAREYHAVDLAATRQIQAELREQGVVSYPAICQCCGGAGKTDLGQCSNCDGRGSYELAV